MKIWKFYTLITIDLILLYISLTNILYYYTRWGEDGLYGARYGFLEDDEHYIGLFLLIPFIVLSIYLYRNAPPKKK